MYNDTGGGKRKHKGSPYFGYDPDLVSLLVPALGMPNDGFPDNPMLGDGPGGAVAPVQKIHHSTMLHRKPKGSKGPQPDSMDQLFNQLLNMVAGQSGPTVDYESALADSQAAIRDAYAQDIAAIRQGNAAARKDTAHNRRLVENLYKGLAKSFVGAGKQSRRQGKRLSKQVRGVGEKSADYLGDAVAKQANQLAKLTQGLGIEEAFPEANQASADAANTAIRRIVTEGSRDARNQLKYAGNEQRYMNRQGGASRMEGSEKSAGLLQDLQNFLQGQHQQIASLKGQRAQELAQNETDTMQSVAQMQQEAANDQWDKLMALAGLKLDINKEQFDQNDALRNYRLQLMSQGDDSGESMPGAENFANAQNYLSQLPHPKRGTALFDQLLNSDQMTSGYFQTGNDAQGDPIEHKMTPYKAMQMIEQAARDQGLSQEDINLLRLAVFAQIG